ncbi:MAG: sugar transferase [Bacteroidetes bacterium]|nr:sugar transferase [Bacteroidota bacterium]
MLKRLFDIFFSTIGIVILMPVFVLIAIGIAIESKGGVLYFQSRVGKNNIDFKLFKFRTMFIDSDKKGLLTIGGKDPRITKIGYYLRKSKLDELPQLLNVFLGTMSLVGPRPEVRKYVEMYSTSQQQILLVKPGITDYASIYYINENDLLAASKNPEQTYINEIMPAKIELNKKYISEVGTITDIKIILQTFKKIIFQ